MVNREAGAYRFSQEDPTVSIVKKLLVGALLLAALSVVPFAETIPYDPSLALANIVPPGKLDILKQIGVENAKIESQEEKLNMLIFTQRSLDLTRQELTDMGITDTKPLDDQLVKVRDDIRNVAIQLADTRMKSYETISKLREQLGSQVNAILESPVDYNRTQIKTMPLSADSLKMNAQYFSYGENEEKASSALAQIRSFVSGETSVIFGPKASVEATNAVSRQVSSQLQNHEVLGTLVISANCTHREAVVLAPFILDVDKAINVWNQMYPDEQIRTNDAAYLAQLAEGQPEKDAKTMTILSGATYGSSFIGMVHIVKEEETKSSQEMLATAASQQIRGTLGRFFANESGTFGLNEAFASDVKSLLSTTKLASHITVYSMGMIPSIKSNNVQTAVKGFQNFDANEMMGKLATLANSTAGGTSVQKSAEDAKKGAQMISFEKAKIESVMTSLRELDKENNQVLDIKSLMEAFEDYVEQARSGQIGVPLNYYLKPITAPQLAQMWVAKYYPEFGIPGGDDR